MKTPIDIAIEMAMDFGWRVFPANPNNKQPLVSNWQNRACKDPSQIRELFARWPNAMIGLPTGAINGLTVIDIDIRDDKNGFVTIDELGLQRLSMYPAVQTPSGGVHSYIFTGDQYYPSSAGRIGLGLDIRSHGGYVIGAGSVSVAGQYEWLCSKQRVLKNDYPMIHELRALLKRHKPRKYSQASAVAQELLRPTHEGSRNVELTRRCGFLMKKYKPETVLDMIHHINKTCFIPPLDAREVISVFNSIRKREGV